MVALGMCLSEEVRAGRTFTGQVQGQRAKPLVLHQRDALDLMDSMLEKKDARSDVLSFLSCEYQFHKFGAHSAPYSLTTLITTLATLGPIFTIFNAIFCARPQLSLDGRHSSGVSIPISYFCCVIGECLLDNKRVPFRLICESHGTALNTKSMITTNVNVTPTFYKSINARP